MAGSVVGPIFDALLKLPVLTPDEEKALARRRDAGDRSAVDEMVCRSQRQVYSIAEECRNRRMEFSDLMSAGQFGLLSAAERFDPALGLRFPSFAAYGIRYSILAEIQENVRLIRIPKHRRSDWKRKSRGKREYKKNPDYDRSAALVKSARFISIDTPHIDDDEEFAHPWECDEPYDDSVNPLQAARESIESLPLAHLRVIDLHYGISTGDPMPIRMVVKILGIDRKKAVKLLNEAHGMLREIIAVEAA